MENITHFCFLFCEALFSPPSCWKQACGLYVLLLFLILFFNDSSQIFYLKIYRTDLRRIHRVGRTMAVDDWSEICFLVPHMTLPNLALFHSACMDSLPPKEGHLYKTVESSSGRYWYLFNILVSYQRNCVLIFAAFFYSMSSIFCIQCHDTVGWASAVRKSIRPVKIEWSVVGVVICRNEVQIICIWSSWCHCIPKTPPCLASFIPGLVLPFSYRLTQVVLEKRPLNGCSVVVDVQYILVTVELYEAAVLDCCVLD